LLLSLNGADPLLVKQSLLCVYQLGTDMAQNARDYTVYAHLRRNSLMAIRGW